VDPKAFPRGRLGALHVASAGMALRLLQESPQSAGRLIVSIDSTATVKPKVKTIALDEETYELLSRQKRGGESFNEVVRRLSQKGRPLHEFAGAWKDMAKDDLRKIEEAIRRGRELDKERFRRLIERWG